MIIIIKYINRTIWKLYPFRDCSTTIQAMGLSDTYRSKT